MKPIICFFACLFIAASAFAKEDRNLAVARADAPASETRVALVIGNSAYKSSPLKNPANDATDIAKELQYLGFRVILRRDASQRDMKQAVREFSSELKRAQVGLFYFAGHGIQVKGGNYLVPVGVDIENEADAEDMSVDANYVLRTMEEAQVKVSIIILDACRNNPFARSFRSASRGLAQMSAATGSLIAFATAPGSVAADGTGRNGLYTQYLLESLRQPNTDILKVFQRVRANVVKDTGGKQTPWESTSLVGDFYFRPGDSVQVASLKPEAVKIQSAEEVEQEFWSQIKDSKDAEDFEAYLKRYPQGRYEALASAALKRLKRQPSNSVKPSTTAEVFQDCSDCPEMVAIPAGSFEMGSPSYEAGRNENESPVHRVSIRSFAMGRNAITRGQFAAFINATSYDAGGRCWEIENGKFVERDGRNWRDPGFRQGDSHPAVCINWNDAQAYAAWLSRKTGKPYRLPTEAEWEYAARAGSNTARYWGESPDQACSHANAGDQTLRSQLAGVTWATHNCTDGIVHTSPVSSFKPNDFGLYDMQGNVWQWVEDGWHENYNGAPSDGTAWVSTDISHPIRGGSWLSDPNSTRAAKRIRNVAAGRDSGNGFRLARTLP